MKNILRILVSAAVALLSLASCESSLGPKPGTEVNLVLAPSVYGYYGSQGVGTKAVDLTHPNNYNGFTSEPAKTVLPVGSTVWLTYRKALVDNPDVTADADWSETNLQAYIVQNVFGNNALYPILSNEVVEDGVTYLEIDPDLVYSSPLYLEEGKYQFRMVSPANRIVKANLKMQVDNGMYVYANDERYEQTASKVIEVVPNVQGIQTIALNPIIAETARFQVKLHPGDNVSSMEMMTGGIEISGLQDPETDGTGKLMFKWSSMNVADTLVMKQGSKRSRVFIKEFDTDESDGTITGSIGILPTNALSTINVVLINLAVNGVPTQYMIVLRHMKYFHGHSYNLEATVGLDGDINVMNWANQSWMGEVTLN